MKFSAAELAFVVHKSKHMEMGLISNLLNYAHKVPHLDMVKKPIDMVVVVGAGPSLEKTGYILNDLQKMGAFIITVNTALPAVAKHGCVPDAVIVREAIDVSGHLKNLGEQTPKNFILDLAANKNIWDTCINLRPNNTFWFVAGALQNFELANNLGVRPVFGGSSALTSAVAIARDNLKAKKIVLMGVDLAFELDTDEQGNSLGTFSKGYANNSAWSGFTGKISGGSVSLSGQGYTDMVTQAADTGISHSSPQEQVIVWNLAYGQSISGHPNKGLSVPLLMTWQDQLHWLETFGFRTNEATAENKMNCTLMDISLQGAYKRSWKEYQNLRSFAYDIRNLKAPKLDQLPGKVIAPETHQDIIYNLKKQCVTLGAISMTVPDPEGYIPSIADYHLGNDIVEAVAAGDLMRLQQEKQIARDNNQELNLGTIIDKCYTHLENASKEVFELLEPHLPPQKPKEPKSP